MLTIGMQVECPFEPIRCFLWILRKALTYHLFFIEGFTLERMQMNNSVVHSCIVLI